MSFFSLVLLSAALTGSTQAGGSNVRLVSINGGEAQGKRVGIIVTVFDPYKNKLDSAGLTKYSYNASGYEPIGIKDLELSLEFEKPLANQHCNMGEGGRTNHYGQVTATCYSDTAGEFIIKTNFKSGKPLHEGGPNAKGSVFTLPITFYQKSTSPDKLPAVISPKISPSPSPTSIVPDSMVSNKLVEIENQNKDQAAQIAELRQSVGEQKQEVSRLNKIIQKIQAFFGGIFK